MPLPAFPDPPPSADGSPPATGRPGPATPPQNTPPLTVVALGASAGGLAALEQMLPRVPPGAPVAWVYAQHLDPALETQLVPVLQRLTPMPVRQAIDGLVLEPGHLVTIPADAALTVTEGRCRLQPLPAAHGRRQTLDLLFDSLARDRGPLAVGVLLSGVGADGCEGLRAIRAAGGLTLAQLPQTAQFDAMPRQALALGVVDIAAPPAELPARLLQALADRGLHGPAAPGRDAPHPARDDRGEGNAAEADGAAEAGADDAAALVCSELLEDELHAARVTASAAAPAMAAVRVVRDRVDTGAPWLAGC